MYLNVLDEVSKNLEVLLQQKGPDGAARLHLEEYFSTFFFLHNAASKEGLGSRLFQKNIKSMMPMLI